jgi:hypothetical protein
MEQGRFCMQEWLQRRLLMTSARQKRKVKKVMHEFKHGELKAGRGRRGKVKNPKQAIAIAMSESGQSYKRRGRKRAAAATSKTASSRKAASRRKRATTGRKTSSRGPTTRRKTATHGRKKRGR